MRREFTVALTRDSRIRAHVSLSKFEFLQTLFDGLLAENSAEHFSDFDIEQIEQHVRWFKNKKANPAAWRRKS